MHGMLMWIVLGTLVGVVVIFLIVQTIFSRKKEKKLKLEKEELEKDIKISGATISKQIMEVINSNNKSLKAFIPSVGKIKMSDINKEAKSGLMKIQRSKMYKLIEHNEEEWKKFSFHLENLISEKSNNWSKRNIKDTTFFKNYKPKEEKKVEKKSKKKIKPTKVAKEKKTKAVNKKGAK